MKKTESEPIELNNHEKMLIRRLAKIIRKDAHLAELERKARIEREDAEDNKYRRKIVK